MKDFAILDVRHRSGGAKREGKQLFLFIVNPWEWWFVILLPGPGWEGCSLQSPIPVLVLPLLQWRMRCGIIQAEPQALGSD